jgi:hypothetical protein
MFRTLSLPIAGLVIATSTGWSETGRAAMEKPPCFLAPAGDFVRDSILEPKQPFELVPGKSPNDWGLVIQPYLWVTALHGTTGVGSLPTMDVSASGKSILQHLDWGVMGMAEIRKGRWGLMADGFYADLSSSGELGGTLYDSVSMSLQQAFFSLALAYRVIDDRRGFLDLYAGARYNYLGLQFDLEKSSTGIARLSKGLAGDVVGTVESTVAKALVGDVEAGASRVLDDRLKRDLVGKHSQRKFESSRRALARYVKAEAVAQADMTKASRDLADAAKRDFADALEKDLESALPGSGSGSRSWVDPLVGLRAQVNLTRWLYVKTQGDVGGFGAGSQLTWNALAALGFNFTRNVYAELGYRYMYVDYDQDNFLFQVNQYGPYASLGFEF